MSYVRPTPGPPPLHWHERAEDPLPLVLQPEDRIAPPRRRGGAALTGSIVLLIALFGGMAMLDDRVREPAPEKPAEPAVTQASADRALPTLPDRAGPQTSDPAGSTPREGGAVAAPAPPVPTPAEPTTAAEPEGPPEPLPPPPIDRNDPWQVRAAAVGLHPELSRVLLMRLSEEDFRNAGIAIRNALAETPNDGAYVYPPQRKAELALFRVHFVKGAPADCRRYVVTVTKDRWAHTALPMEKCGIAPVRRGRAP